MEEKKGIKRIRNRKYIQSTLKERTFPSAERNSVKKKKKKRGEFGEKILLSKKLCVDQSTLQGFRPNWKETLQSRKAKNMIQSCH